MTWSQAQELADAIKRLGATKPVHAYLRDGQTMSYLVASAANKVTMDPAVTVMLVGLSSEVVFVKGTLDRVGVEPQIVQVGKYKGAIDPLTTTQPSAELREQHERLLDDLYAQLCEQIAAQRKLDVDAVKKAIDQGPLTAPEAQQLSLVDSLQSAHEWQQQVKDANGGEACDWVENYAAPKEELPDLSNPFAAMKLLFAAPSKKVTHDPTIAIIHANGVIISGRSDQGLFGQTYAGARSLRDCFEQVAKDPHVKAVVFRIDSPGGSAEASENIYQAVRECAAVKPVVVSIGQLGASGGYYVAVAADTIIADPAAIVGSIGVFGGKLATSGLMEKIGITTWQTSRGKNAGLFNSHPWSDSQAAAIRKITQHTYDLFCRRVAAGRAGKVANIDDVAQGRVFTGRQALENHLVDRVGGLRDAVAAAAEAANVTHFEVISLPQSPSLTDMLMGGQLQARLGAAAAPNGPEAFVATMLDPASAYLLDLTCLLDREPVLMAMPYWLNISP